MLFHPNETRNRFAENPFSLRFLEWGIHWRRSGLIAYALNFGSTGQDSESWSGYVTRQNALTHTLTPRPWATCDKLATLSISSPLWPNRPLDSNVHSAYVTIPNNYKIVLTIVIIIMIAET